MDLLRIRPLSRDRRIFKFKKAQRQQDQWTAVLAKKKVEYEIHDLKSIKNTSEPIGGTASVDFDLGLMKYQTLRKRISPGPM